MRSVCWIRRRWIRLIIQGRTDIWVNRSVPAKVLVKNFWWDCGLSKRPRIHQWPVKSDRVPLGVIHYIKPLANSLRSVIDPKTQRNRFLQSSKSDGRAKWLHLWVDLSIIPTWDAVIPWGLSNLYWSIRNIWLSILCIPGRIGTTHRWIARLSVGT